MNTTRRANVSAVATVAAAVITAFFLWVWLAGQITPRLPSRDALLVCDIVAALDAGRDVPGSLSEDLQLDNPLVRAAAWTGTHCGASLRGMLWPQVFFVIVLLISVAALAWRWGGPSAAGLAAWLALAAPVTLGSALEFTDLAALQAGVAGGVACLAWIRRPRDSWLALVATLCVAVPVAARATFSTGAIAVLTYGLASLAVLTPGLLRRRETPEPRSWLPAALWALGLVLLIPLLHPRFAGLQADYFTHELGGTGSVEGGFSPAALLGYPSIWALLQVGPVIALACLAATGVALRRKEARRVAVPLIWLFGTMLALSVLPKRNEYYLLGAVPASYVLAATVAARLPRRALIAAWMLVALASAYGAYLYVDANAYERLWHRTKTVAADTAQPFDYFSAFRNGALNPYRPRPDNARTEEDIVAEAVTRHCGELPLVRLFPWGRDCVLDFYLWRARGRRRHVSAAAADAPLNGSYCLLIPRVPGAADDDAAAQLSAHLPELTSPEHGAARLDPDRSRLLLDDVEHATLLARLPGRNLYAIDPAAP
ncbi:MAG: hypothetical protein P9L99_12075 [Candidatus Lernaella stagnicola]|nr:hypothetical protein [Candidatus Lernaella stagnicola]